MTGAASETPSERRAEPTAAAYRCTDAARERDDPQLGTAPQTRRWLLLEHRGPWQVDALAGSRLSESMIELLGRTARAETARILLIRRPGRSDVNPIKSWAVVYEDGSVRWGSWRSDDELRVAADALAAARPPADGSAEPILLVCAHGLHDVCCALRGRPVAAALALEWPAATWECSHVGGDRFAANVVVLPDGVYYGNLDPDNAVAAIREHLQGAVPVRHLRGMTRVPPPAQVAIAAVHAQYGPYGARDVEVTATRHTAEGLWQVELRAPRLARVEVTVAVSRRAPAQLTCRAPSETPAMLYHVVEVSVS